jgi:AbrB family looped-hinge helix DNA binding protein
MENGEWRSLFFNFPLIFPSKKHTLSVGQSLLALQTQLLSEVLTMIVDNAKVMSKGQITLPKDIRAQLRLSVGDRVTLICENNRVVLMNSALYALKEFQDTMQGEAERAGLKSDEDVVDLIMQMRHEEEQ